MSYSHAILGAAALLAAAIAFAAASGPQAAEGGGFDGVPSSRVGAQGSGDSMWRINKQTGALEGVPEIITRGFVMEDSQALLADGVRMLSEVMEHTSVEERTDQGLIKEKLRVELRRFLRKRSGRRPFVLPVIMEI